MRTGRCRGAPPRLPFFFVVGAFGTRVSAAVACKPSVYVKHRYRYEGKFSYLMLVAGAGLPRSELLTSATGRGTLVFPNVGGKTSTKSKCVLDKRSKALLHFVFEEKSGPPIT